MRKRWLRETADNFQPFMRTEKDEKEKAEEKINWKKKKEMV